MSPSLQALKKAFSAGNFSWQQPDTDPTHAGVLHGTPSDWSNGNPDMPDIRDTEAVRLASE